jgi:hypothetical protein
MRHWEIPQQSYIEVITRNHGTLRNTSAITYRSYYTQSWDIEKYLSNHISKLRHAVMRRHVWYIHW